jgi:hypothetical protein
LGDVSPNLEGPKCIDTGLACDLYESTCDGKTQNCIAFGPGNDMKDSTYIIAQRQYLEAKVREQFDHDYRLPHKVIWLGANKKPFLIIAEI